MKMYIGIRDRRLNIKTAICVIIKSKMVNFLKASVNLAYIRITSIIEVETI